MNMEDLEMLAKIIWKRKDQLIDAKVSQIEQERYRLFMWIMFQMWMKIERDYPHVGKIVIPFIVEVKSKWSVCIKTNRPGTNDSYNFEPVSEAEETIYPWPGIESNEYVKIVAELVSFISLIEGYEVINRFPKNSNDEIQKFQVVCDYRKTPR